MTLRVLPSFARPFTSSFNGFTLDRAPPFEGKSLSALSPTYRLPRPSHCARLIMNINPDSSAQPPQPSDDNDGEDSPGATPSNETTDIFSDCSDEQTRNPDAPSKDGQNHSTTESLFSGEILRRRIARLNDPNSQKISSSQNGEDTALDISIIFDEANGESLEVAGEWMDAEEADHIVSKFENLSSVWVILFTNTKSGVEGLYSLTVDKENTVLAFESRQEAHRFAICLEAQNFPSPQVSEMDTAELRDFCAESRTRLGFIPTGVMLVPPDESAVEDLDSWRGPSSETGMSDEDIDTMRRRFDSLFGK